MLLLIWAAAGAAALYLWNRLLAPMIRGLICRR
jgi:hypothetical protein